MLIKHTGCGENIRERKEIHIISILLSVIAIIVYIISAFKAWNVYGNLFYYAIGGIITYYAGYFHDKAKSIDIGKEDNKVIILLILFFGPFCALIIIGMNLKEVINLFDTDNKLMSPKTTSSSSTTTSSCKSSNPAQIKSIH
jgi:hypothetical protein